jgi:hypothetical protein
MFSWLSSSHRETAQATGEPSTTLTPQDPVAETFTVRSDGEFNDLEDWLESSRPSPVSRAKWTHWKVADDNAQLGGVMRGASGERSETKAELRHGFLERTYARKQEAKAQRKEQRIAHNLSVREQRQARAAKAEQLKEEMSSRAALATAEGLTASRVSVGRGLTDRVAESRCVRSPSRT